MPILLDQDTIDELLEMVEDAPEVLVEIVDSYTEQGALALIHITHAIEVKDAKQLCETAHALKGSSYNLGAFILANIANELEHKGLDEDWQDVNSLHIKLQQCYKESLVAIQSLKQLI